MSLPTSSNNLRSFMLNFGPQHPAAHGILSIGLSLSGEVINSADLQFGLLHSGSENLCESSTFSQIIPYVDSMDYVANLIQEHSAVLCLESLSGNNMNPSFTTQLVSVISDELSSILNHLLTMSAICLDMGAMGPIFWAFEESEVIMEVFESSSGASMHTALYRIGGLGSDFLLNSFNSDLLFVISSGSSAICGAFVGLISNSSLKSSLAAVGSFSLNKVKDYGITGVIARSSGLGVDLSLGLGGDSYSIYTTLPTSTFLGNKGDSYDSFMVSASEMLESYSLISLTMSLFGSGITGSSNINSSKFVSMESVINHFKGSTHTVSKSSAMSFGWVEGPNGKVGSFVVSSGSVSPYSFHFSSPVAHNLHLLETSCNFVTFADFVATFCSLDVVLGEIDR